MSKRSSVTSDPVVELTRGQTEHVFGYDEWTAARVLWIRTGQRLGGPATLFQAETATLGAVEIAQVRDMVEAATTTVLPRELNGNLEHSGAAGAELFALVKRSWKLPYRHTSDSSDTVRVGGKKVADHGAPGAPPIPSFGDISAVRSAYDKLLALTRPGPEPLSLLVIGPRYARDRR